MYAPYTKTQLLLWCQQNLDNNLMRHPVHPFRTCGIGGVSPVRRVEDSEGWVDVALEGVDGRLDDEVVHPRDEVGGQGDEEGLRREGSRKEC